MPSTLPNERRAQSSRSGTGGDEAFTDTEKWVEIRRRVLTGEISKRTASAKYIIHCDALNNVLTHTQLPGYRLATKRSSKLEPFLPAIHEILNN